jgi:hypothetical protein
VASTHEEHSASAAVSVKWTPGDLVREVGLEVFHSGWHDDHRALRACEHLTDERAQRKRSAAPRSRAEHDQVAAGLSRELQDAVRGISSCELQPDRRAAGPFVPARGMQVRCSEGTIRTRACFRRG